MLLLNPLPCPLPSPSSHHKPYCSLPSCCSPSLALRTSSSQACKPRTALLPATIYTHAASRLVV
uniref:Uncharacterized protein n=1 Tax=Arundo donax TaxID=35708 RepID=A0A0A9IXD1_ARUDO